MSLSDSQHLLWRLITAPEGVEKALEEDPREATALATTVTGNQLNPVRCLNVYAEAYFARIHDVLQRDFSDLAAQLGEATFHDLVTSYLAVTPPERPSLRDVGERLPSFLAQHPQGEPFRKRAPWAAALAQLEWTQLDIFDAPDAKTTTRQVFEALPPEEWADEHLSLIPAAELLSLDWPVHTLCASWPNQSENDAPITQTPTTLLIWRKWETVSYRPLDPAEAKALTQVAKGTTFAAICQTAANELNEQKAPTQAATWLTTWLAEGLLEKTT